MRALMAAERPAGGEWDMKLSPGGLVDIEFAAQHLQLVHAASGGPLEPHTAAALKAMGDRGLAPVAQVRKLEAAWTLQQNLSQLLKVALQEAADPSGEPAAFRKMLARAGGCRSFEALKERLQTRRAAAREAFLKLVKV